LDLRDAVTAVRTRWWMPAAGLLVGALLALAMALTSVPQYTAQTQLFVSTTDSTSATDALQGSQFSQARVSSYAQLLMGEVLARRVIDDLDLDLTPSALASQVNATPVLDTVLIDVSVTDSSPTRARDIAADLGVRFPRLVSELEHPGAEGSSPVTVTVTRPPDLPAVPSSPRTTRDVGLGLLAGLVIGVAAAIARTALDRSVREPQLASELAGAPVLGMIIRDEGLDRGHVIDQVASSGAAEGFRQLRSNLQYLSVDNPPQVILVSSAIPGQGKSTTVVNLGVALARAGRQVTIVDGDLRKPMVASYLGLVEGAGLSDVLARRAEVADVLQSWGDGSLSVISAGPVPPNPGELLASSQMEQLLDELRQKNDFVLIDTPPLLPVADATGVSVMVDGVVLCARFGDTKRDQLQQTRATLDRVGARTLGVVVNAVPRRSKVTAAFGYQYTAGYQVKGQTSRRAARLRALLRGARRPRVDRVPAAASATRVRQG
jgi:capsular exopolysaccharide synthesis family protein